MKCDHLIGDRSRSSLGRKLKFGHSEKKGDDHNEDCHNLSRSVTSPWLS